MLEVANHDALDDDEGSVKRSRSPVTLHLVDEQDAPVLLAGCRRSLEIGVGVALTTRTVRATLIERTSESPPPPSSTTPWPQLSNTNKPESVSEPVSSTMSPESGNAASFGKSTASPTTNATPSSPFWSEAMASRSQFATVTASSHNTK